MKYRLLYAGDFKKMWGTYDFAERWDLKIDVVSIMATHSIKITAITSYDDSCTVHLSGIPARIDLDKDTGAAWIQDAEYVSKNPLPYRSLASDGDNIILWQLGEREEATIEEVGELAYG